jgi:hypothetical protein
MPTTEHRAYNAFKHKVIEWKTKLESFRNIHYGLNESSNIDDGVFSDDLTLINILLGRMHDVILYMDRAMLPVDNINYVDASRDFKIFDENFIVVEYIIGRLLANNLELDLQIAINHMANVEQHDGSIEAVLSILYPGGEDMVGIEGEDNPYAFYVLNTTSNYNIDELFHMPKIGTIDKESLINNELLEIFDFSPSAFKAEYIENFDFIDLKLDLFILSDSAFYLQQ